MSALLGCFLLAALVGYFTGPIGFAIVLALGLIGAFGWWTVIALVAAGVGAFVWSRFRVDTAITDRAGSTNSERSLDGQASMSDINRIVDAMQTYGFDADFGSNFDNFQDAPRDEGAEKRAARRAKAVAFVAGAAIGVEAGKTDTRRKDADAVARDIAWEIDRASIVSNDYERSRHLAKAETLKAKLAALNVH